MSGNQYSCFEYLFDILGWSRVEQYTKMLSSCKLLEKTAINNILLGSHMKNLFLPNKNLFSMVSVGIDNSINIKINDLSKFTFEH